MTGLLLLLPDEAAVVCPTFVWQGDFVLSPPPSAVRVQHLLVILVAVRYYKLSDSVQINTLTMGQCMCVHACVRV